MAITSSGYDGTVGEVSWASMAHAVGATQYGVVGAGDWRVSAVSAADRTVSVAAGSGWGNGVYDISTTNYTIQLDTLASGVRWDLIVAHRDSTGAGGVTTFTKVTGTSARAIPVSRANAPGVTDDQPLALVQITAGQTQPTAIIDLRCWGGNGGMCANDTLALSYLDRVGAKVEIAGEVWSQTVGLSGTPSWTKVTSTSAVPLFGVGGSLGGNLYDTFHGQYAGANFLIQAGTTIANLDALSYGRITWPRPFPNGLLTVIATNGDDWATGGIAWFNSAGQDPYHGSSGLGDKTSWVYSMITVKNGIARRQTPGTLHRINWIAIGF